MQNLESFTRVVLLACALAGFSGCGGRPGTGGAATGDAHEHDHSHEGVHGGQVIELGDENYHAELVHDDATHKVGVYLLDGTAKSAAPIDAPNITINFAGPDGKPVKHTLAPAPQTGDPTGRASYFELTSEELCEGLDTEEAVAQVNITIDGKQYVGDVETHAHDHEHGHDHDHK